MTNVMTNEILKEEQLEQVAGGTVKEYSELCSAMAKNPTLQKIMGGTSHIPVANTVNKKILEVILKTKMGIDAKIDLGFCGTGIGSEPNTYRDMFDGNRIMTHAEVVDRIKMYAV